MRFRDRLGYQVGLIGFIRVSTLLRLLHLLPTLSLSKGPRLLGVVLGSVLAAPFGFFERLRYGRRIAETEISEAPVFIIGHWRSGTTHLHNLMSQDPAMGSLRMFQTLTPDCSVATRGWLPKLLARVMPRQRPMDAMEWPMDAPQEEEIALAKMTPYSWYLSFFFPKRAVKTFERFVLLRGAGERVRREVERSLMRVYRIATFHEEGRRLLLKNPVNTCRIPMLLRLFPNAKFVFIHRDPYAVFNSTLNLHRRILEVTSLQEIGEDAIEENVIRLHQQVTEAYLQDRAQIPEGQLVEIAYSELVEKPEAVLAQIYWDLGLPGHAEAAQPFVTYLESQRGYTKNAFQRDPAKSARVRKKWQADFEAWNYGSESEPTAAAAPAAPASAA
ncbi:MAG: sulfotransferase [Myxococcota bacterium]